MLGGRRSCELQRQVPAVPDASLAVLGSVVNTCIATVIRWLLEEFHDFLREGVDSYPEACSPALRSRSGTADASVAFPNILLGNLDTFLEPWTTKSY